MSLSSKLSLADISVTGKRVICRVDFNVPLDKDQNITDDRRIRETIPTLERILSQDPKSLVICSHLGRPKGNVVDAMSLRPVISVLSEYLGRPVHFMSDWRGKNLNEYQRGEVILLENLRFHIEEEGKGLRGKKKVKADKKAVAQFRRDLASLGEVFVFDAFATAHRGHSSVVGLRNLEVRAAGYLMKKELDAFSVLEAPKRPFCAVLGGAKVKDKVPVIMNLLKKVDHIIIGGGMAFSFLKIQGMNIGNSLFDESAAKEVPEIIRMAKQRGVSLHLPEDFIVAPKFAEDAPDSYSYGSIADGMMGLDIGRRSIEKFVRVLDGCSTIVANGPMGVFEWNQFALGTESVLKKMNSMKDAVTIVGGGDTAAAAKKFRLKKMTHISTGGGASLALLEGKSLPGIESLSLKSPRSKL